MGLLGPSKKEKEYLLNWENLVNNTPDNQKLHFNGKQLQALTNEIFHENFRILNDTLNILKETTNPNTYFSKFDLAEQKLSFLLRFNEYIKLQDNYTINDLYQEFYNDINNCTTMFIERTWKKYKDKADKLKTNKGKKRCLDEFKEQISLHNDRLNQNHKIMYENYYDLAIAQIEEQKVSVNSLGERLDKLNENGELPFGWTYYHPELEKYDSEIVQLALAIRNPQPVDDDILAYRKLIDRYYEYKEYCYRNGECYKKYFSDYYEHCHNSVSEDFCYITSFENELEDILNHYSEKASEYNDFLDCQKFINTKSMEIFNVIKSMPGILQKDLKKRYDKKYNSSVDTILYQLSKQGKIVQEKCGNSNKLFIK